MEVCCAVGPLGLFSICPPGSVLRGQTGLRCCVSLGKLPSLSEPPFSHLSQPLISGTSERPREVRWCVRLPAVPGPHRTHCLPTWAHL